MLIINVIKLRINIYFWIVATVNELLNDERYKELCKIVATNSSLWEDLYQDFCVRIIEIGSKIEKIERVEGYCFLIISNMWKKRGQFAEGKKHTGGQTRHNISDFHVELTPGTVDYDRGKNDEWMGEEKKQELIDAIYAQINKLKKTNNPETLNSLSLLSEFLNGKNRLKISKEKGINYRTVHESIENAIDLIKSNMTGKPSKAEISIKLRAEGINASYSGKTKTFYVTKEPAEKTKELISKSEFKIQKK